MGTEVMQSRYLLTVTRVPPMPFHRRRIFVGDGSLTNLSVNWKGNSADNRMASPKSDQKKNSQGNEAKKPTSLEPRRKNGFSDSDLVMVHVTILRRGKALNSFTSKTKGGDSESTSPNQKPVEDLTVCIIVEEEMARREKLRDLALFEMLHGNPAKSFANLEFCRTITARDVKASDVRHVSVLEATLNYLRNLLNSSEGSFEVIHDFIFDRTRCIRQDLSLQNSMGDQVIHMNERMDMSQQPPWQKLVASDLHGNQWNFRHIFRAIHRLLFLSLHFELWGIFSSAMMLRHSF